MKFRRRAETTRRQRLVDDGQPSQLSSFAYSSRQSKQAEQTKRQPQSRNQSPPSRMKWGRFWLQRVGLLVFLLALLASAVNILSLSSSSKVIPLTQSSKSAYLRPTQVYADAADKILKSSIWNRSKVTVDAAGLSHQLLNQFPELASASVTMPLLAHRPLVYIEPVQQALVLNTSNGSFVIGTSGKALARIANNSQIPSGLPNLTDQSGLQVQTRQQALPAPAVRFVQVVVAELAAKQYDASILTLPGASSELDAHLAGYPYFVKFNLENSDPAGEAATFLATINGLKHQNITPTQYIDVRVDGRAYYR